MTASLSEKFRERETYKYDILERTSTNFNNPEDPIPTSNITSAPDQGLTAFAQLGAFRLNATRGLISLFDRKYQHIVAEATQSSPLAADVNEDDGLWICGTSIPRSFGICEHVLLGPVFDPDGQPTELPVSVVPDLELDVRFCDRPFIKKGPRNRFYAGVPIRSPAGLNIGAFCIFDTKPRDGLTQNEIRFMRDMSVTIMDYLHQRKSNESYRRSERMVRGMGNFVEGQSSLSTQSSAGARKHRQTLVVNEQAPTNKTLPVSRCDSQTDLSQLQGSYRRPSGSPAPSARKTSIAGGSPLMPPQPNSKAQVSQVSTTDIKLAEAGQVFSKAANIIRESIEVEGVLFLDATVRSFGGLVLDQQDETRSRSIDEFSGDEDAGTPTHSAANREDLCNVLGFSTPGGCSIKGDCVPWQFEGLRDKVLQTLLSNYPNGKIFNFDADGSALPNRSPPLGGPISPTPNRQGSQDGLDYWSSRSKRWNEASCVYQMFPGARSVVVIPLWDGRKKRFAAGGFIWTTNPTRVFAADGELSFLKVFGLTIMAEINRMDTKAEESIKSNILGSLSHELRSPLHGLVGAVELLNDSKLDAVQQNVLHIIETSGKTLVDTINHLLDYSKINSFLETDKRNGVLGKAAVAGDNWQGPADQRSQILPVELDCIVEEVVESVLAGFSHEKVSSYARTFSNFANNDTAQDPSSPSLRPRQEEPRVQIYLEVEPCASWRFQTHPGAFRRIVMNLLGNSLKFTSPPGFIKVSLTQEVPKPEQKNAAAKIILIVSDSGKGIGEDYLRNHLFTPFCQENSFAPGTGLGLSLVRQIAVNLGGDINVASRVGVGHGTVITVSLPLPQTADGLNGAETETEFERDARSLAGLKAELRSFDTSELSNGLPESQGLGKLPGSPADFMENTLRSWLRMQVSRDSATESRLEGHNVGKPDIIIYNDYSLTFSDAKRIAAAAPCPVLFISDMAMAVRNFSCSLTDGANRPRVFEFLAPPFGPRKLARVFLHLRNQWQASLAVVGKEPNGEGTANITSDLVTSPVETNIVGKKNQVTEASSVTSVKASGEGIFLKQLPVELHETAELTTSAEGPLIRNMSVVPIVNVPSTTPLANASAKKEPVVLIVDDNAINLKILSAYMKKLGRPYRTAIDGLDSSSLYCKSPGDYCCILTDISMPIMDGLESARRIRQHEQAHRLKATPIIALSGLSGQSIQQDAIASGVDLFLTRPVSLKRLIESLETVGLGCVD